MADEVGLGSRLSLVFMGDKKVFIGDFNDHIGLDGIAMSQSMVAFV